MLRQRVLTAVVGILALIVVVFLLPSGFALACYVAAILFAAWEWSALVRLSGHLARIAYVAAIGALMALGSRYGAVEVTYRLLLFITAGWWLIALLWLAFMPDGGSLVSAGYDGTVRLWPLSFQPGQADRKSVV